MLLLLLLLLNAAAAQAFDAKTFDKFEADLREADKFLASDDGR